MLILASLSPRRRELLRLITDDFIAVAPACDEDIPAGTPPEEAVIMLARRKALSVSHLYPGAVIIGADTVVALDGVVLGKPENEKDALRMLALLSGREHEVYTGVSIVWGEKAETFFSRTLVRFRELSPAEMNAYVSTGESMDKAGAYGIQGRAAVFVSGITGDYYNVVGLPLCVLSEALGPFLY